MNHRLKLWSRKQLSPHISPLGLLQKMGWFQNGTLWKLDFYEISKERNQKTWKMVFKSVSCDKNWKFWSKAIDFSWEIGYYFGTGNKLRRGCQILPAWVRLQRALSCMSFFSWLLSARLRWWVIFTWALAGYFHFLEVLVWFFIKIQGGGGVK